MHALVKRQPCPKVRRVPNRSIQYSFSHTSPPTSFSQKRTASWTARIVTDFLRSSQIPRVFNDSLSSVINSWYRTHLAKLIKPTRSVRPGWSSGGSSDAAKSSLSLAAGRCRSPAHPRRFVHPALTNNATWAGSGRFKVSSAHTRDTPQRRKRAEESRRSPWERHRALARESQSQRRQA